jgi:hypothetical protein
MILMGANPWLGPLEGVDPRNVPPSKSLRPAPYKQKVQYINSYIIYTLVQYQRSVGASYVEKPAENQTSIHPASYPFGKST